MHLGGERGAGVTVLFYPNVVETREERMKRREEETTEKMSRYK